MVDGHQPLTDSQWQVIAPLLPVPRKRRHCLRQVFDAMRYSCRTGCQWRSLPTSFPAWSAGYSYFRRWQLSGLWQTLTDRVNQAGRLAAGRPATPSLVCLDSQSVRLAPRICEANGHDGVEALALLPARPSWGQRLVTVVTDKGYRGRLARQLARLGLTHQLGSRPPSARGFVPVAKRWVVERTFAWLTGFRRLAIDYEFTPRSHETWLLIANMTLCLNRLAST